MYISITTDEEIKNIIKNALLENNLKRFEIKPFIDKHEFVINITEPMLTGVKIYIKNLLTDYYRQKLIINSTALAETCDLIIHLEVPKNYIVENHIDVVASMYARVINAISKIRQELKKSNFVMITS